MYIYETHIIPLSLLPINSVFILDEFRLSSKFISPAVVLLVKRLLDRKEKLQGLISYIQCS
jgi:hypothetical protein